MAHVGWLGCDQGKGPGQLSLVAVDPIHVGGWSVSVRVPDPYVDQVVVDPVPRGKGRPKVADEDGDQALGEGDDTVRGVLLHVVEEGWHNVFFVGAVPQVKAVHM